MNNTLEYFFSMADADFSGRAYNGPSLMETLKSLSLEDAKNQNTFEGYSAWEVAAHCGFCTFIMAESTGSVESLKPLPFEKASFPKIPSNAGEAEWQELLTWLVKAHEVVMQNFRAFPVERYTDIMPLWKNSYGNLIAWYISHDSYHACQIRNMGLESLKQAKL